MQGAISQNFFRFTAMACLLAVVFTAGSAEARVWYVGGGSGSGVSWSDSFLTLQEAVDAASAGDSIWITIGNYHLSEPVRIDKPLYIYGGFIGVERGPRERKTNMNTVLSGDSLGMIITADTLLNGITFKEFTLENFDPFSGGMSGYAAGLSAENCRLWLHRCSFERNNGNGTIIDVGGVYARNCQIDIVGCRFVENKSYISPAGSGQAGLFLSDCRGIVRLSYFTDNVKDGANILGGKVRVDRCYFVGNMGSGLNISGDHIVQESVFSHNYSYMDSHPSGGYFGGVSVYRCMMSGNLGGALFADSSRFYNCCIINNGASRPTPTSPRASVDLQSSALINCTVAENLVDGVPIVSSGASSIMNSIVWSGSGANGMHVETGSPRVAYSLLTGGFPGAGNIDADPGFIDFGNRNCRLRRDSPCIDAGSAGIRGRPLQDYDGQRRIFGRAPDMGAYEWRP